MKHEIDILFDDEMRDLLQEEGVSDLTLQQVISKFIKDSPQPELGENSNFIIRFVNTNDKNYSLYGNFTPFNNFQYMFEIELLGVSLKKAKIKPC